MTAPFRHDGLNADQGAVANSATVQHRLMADGDVLTDGEWKADVGMHHRSFLHVAVGPDADQLVIAPQSCSEPYTRVLREHDLADQRRVRRDVRTRGDDWNSVAQLINRHTSSAQ